MESSPTDQCLGKIALHMVVSLKLHITVPHILDTKKLYLFGGIKFTANKPSKHQGPMDTIEIDLSKVLSENKITKLHQTL